MNLKMNKKKDLKGKNKLNILNSKQPTSYYSS